MLRRSQLALKAPETDEDKGENKKKGPGRPKGKPSAAKSKAKAKAKSKAKGCKKLVDNKGDDHDGDHPEATSTSDIGKGDPKDATPEDAEVRQDPSAGTDLTDIKPSEKPVKRKKTNKDPNTLADKPIKKIKQDQIQKPEKTDETKPEITKEAEITVKHDAEPDKPDKPGKPEDKKDIREPPKKKPRGQAATFARRVEPSTPYGRAKWSALRDAFVSVIKPTLSHYSAAEDSLMIRVCVWHCWLLFLVVCECYLTNSIEYVIP